MQPVSTKLRGNTYILAAALIWSTGGLLIKFIPWNGIVINSIRSLLAFLFLAFMKKSLHITINKSIIGGALGLATVTTLFALANKMTTAANAIVLQYLSPIFVLIMTCLRERRRPTKRQITIISVTFFGMVLFFIDQLAPGYIVGNLLAVLAGVGFACVFFFNSQKDGSSEDANMLGFLIAFVIGLPAIVLDPPAITVQSVTAILVLGVFQVGFAYYIFGKGLMYTDPVNASQICMVEAIANPIWVFIALGEKPGIFAVIGCVLVLSAVAVHMIRPENKITYS